MITFLDLLPLLARYAINLDCVGLGSGMILGLCLFYDV